NRPVAGCIACKSCYKTGKCVQQDKVNEFLERADTIDALVIGSPVYYAGPTGQLTAFLDRLFFAAGGRWAGKLGAAVVSCRRGGATAAFDRLNKYFTISNMPVVSSQYWNQVHGFTPEDVRKDEEGLQTMRTLGENMAWLLRCIEAGREAGVPKPEYEPWVATNFIH
ncbi:MAG: flavodoxin family protein, partial [Fretibacterium sp.]|nr:flavodoxin family protein [Fretibacterium sp.]